jgi:VanZ family protein
MHRVPRQASSSDGSRPVTPNRPSPFRPGWVLSLAPAVLSVLVVFVLGSAEMPPMPEADFQWRDKVGHLFAFGFVQITHARALEFLAIPKARSAQIAGAVLSATLVGGLLEIWQAFLPHRSAEWGDLLADGVGAILAGILYSRLFRPDEGEGTS